MGRMGSITLHGQFSLSGSLLLPSPGTVWPSYSWKSLCCHQIKSFVGGLYHRFNLKLHGSSANKLVRKQMGHPVGSRCFVSTMIPIFSWSRALTLSSLIRRRLINKVSFSFAAARTSVTRSAARASGGSPSPDRTHHRTTQRRRHLRRTLHSRTTLPSWPEVRGPEQGS